MQPIELGQLLDGARWNWYLRVLVFLTAITVLFDGADLQAFGVALPSIGAEWKLTQASLVAVVAAGMFGMMIGSAFAGMIGDRFGRKAALSASVFLFGLSTFAIALVHGPRGLIAVRLIAGLGMGGAIPNAATLVSEFVPLRHRSLTVTLTVLCVPLGGMLAAFVAETVLVRDGWRVLFMAGGVAPLLVGVLLWLFLAESPQYLVRRPARSEELARNLRQLGHDVPVGSSFAGRTDESDSKAPFAALFAAGLKGDTLALFASFFFSMLATYTASNWVPSAVARAGFGVALGSRGAFYFNFGGILGTVAGGLLLVRFGSRRVMLSSCIIAVAGACFLSARLALSVPSLLLLLSVLALLGSAINSVQTTLFALAARVFPPPVRATGIGASAAIGRSGGLVSSYLGATALSHGGPMLFFIAIAAAMASAFFALTLVRRHTQPA